MALSETQLIRGPRFTHERTGDARALLTDVDQTLLPNQSFDVPSARVTKAIRKAAEIMPVGIATARQPQKADYLIPHLGLTGLTIYSNGAQIYDGETGLMVVERSLSINTTMEITRELQAHGVDHWIQDGGYDHRWVPTGRVPRRDRRYSKGLGKYRRPADILDPSKGQIEIPSYIPQKPFIIVAHEVSAETAATINDMTQSYAHEGFISFIAHENAVTHLFDVFITHKNTNKKDAMNEVAQMQNIPLEDTLAMGDGPNDTVLVENAGIGVAMGNGVDATKAVAVYIAPDQIVDGAAIAIEELILAPRKAA